MKRSKKIFKNLIFGFIAEAVAILLGVIVPRLTLTNYGSEVNGLVSTIGQIYAYVALLEAGIGLATIQALYKPISEDNKDSINSILSATAHYYKRTGFIYACIVVVFSSIYPFLLTTEIPRLTVFFIVFFNGVGQIISYFFQAKYFLLLQAEGKNYIYTNLNMVTNIIKNIAKIWLMRMGVGVIYVQTIGVFVSMIQMMYMAWYIKRNYPWINLSVMPNKQALSQNKNVLIHQVSWLIVNNTDAVVLTFFCGLKTVSVYAIYILLYGMVNTVLTMAGDSVKFDLGQSFYNKTRFNAVFNLYEILFTALLFSLFSITNFFMTPFLMLYTKGVVDISYIDQWLPLLFSLMYILMQSRKPAHDIVKVAGHFKQTQNQAVVEAIINITVSIVMVYFLGIYGVIIGTIVALLYRTNALITYTNRKIIQRSNWISYKRLLVLWMVFAVVQIINQFLNIQANSYLKLFCYCIPYALVSFIVYFGIVCLFEIKTIKKAIQTLKNKKIIKKEILNEDIG